ncbi:unnamed protein product [Owenia fusiformis]|uniref:Uncharacterized protein n=1 Tax=Owenia fusiformis TaxID=6347 RepID=A0A8J1YCU4_OWEFU|nr:unnamed protein product [Owenia fusiformis]
MCLLKLDCNGYPFQGMYLEIVGPTLQDLKYRVNSNYEEIARALFARSVGFFIGSLAGGFLCDRYRDKLDIFLASSFILSGVGTCIAPWCSALWLLGCMFHLQGLGQGCLGTIGQALVINMWGESSGPPVHSLHFAFGIGATIVPQIVRPFLSSTPESIDYNTTVTVNSTMVIPTWNSTMVIPTWNSTMVIPTGNFTVNDARIEVPYSIVGIVTIIFSFIFMGYYFVSRKRSNTEYDLDHEGQDEKSTTLREIDEKSTTLREMFSTEKCTQGHKAFGIQMLFLIFLFSGIAIGGERVYGKFVFSYATDTKMATKSEATVIETIFWSSFMVGRGLAIIVAKFCPPKLMLLIEIIANVVVGVVLNIWGNTNITILWVFTGAFGIVNAPVFPSGIAWVNLYLEQTGLVTAMTFVGQSVGGMVFQWLTGYLFEYYGPLSFLYTILGYTIALAAVSIIMGLLTFRRKDRFQHIKEESSK